MRTYTLDQLLESDTQSLAKLLDTMELGSTLEGIYWLPVPLHMLTPLQKEHAPECGPYCLALEVETEAVHLELLVRGQGRIRCECLSFASPELREHMISYLEGLLLQLDITF